MNMSLNNVRSLVLFCAAITLCYGRNVRIIQSAESSTISTINQNGKLAVNL